MYLSKRVRRTETAAHARMKRSPTRQMQIPVIRGPTVLLARVSPSMEPILPTAFVYRAKVECSPTKPTQRSAYYGKLALKGNTFQKKEPPNWIEHVDYAIVANIQMFPLASNAHTDFIAQMVSRTNALWADTVSLPSLTVA